MSTAVVVLGAGPAGVGAAYQLAKRGDVSVTVLERAALPGGNAGSFELAGMSVDYGSHRLHPECDAQILADLQSLLGEDLLIRPRHGRIRLRGRWLDFPLRLLDLARNLPMSFARGAAQDALLSPIRRATRASGTFAGVLRRNLGPTICNDFYFPYAEKVWGLPADRISAIQARKRVSAGSALQILARLLPGRRRMRGSFYYPRGGYGRIVSALAEEAVRLGAVLEYEAAVEGVERCDGRVVAVRARRGDELCRYEADQVWSTLPMSALVGMVEPAAPSQVRAAAAALEFRSIVLVYLVLRTPRFSEYDAHYFPELSIRISRLSEPKNYAAATAPDDRTVLCAELPCDADGDVWRMEDQELGSLVEDDMARAGIPIGAPVVEVMTRRVRHGYPVYRVGFERYFDVVDQWLGGIDGLLTFGRQGLFAHDNTHHALSMAYAAARSLRKDGGFDDARWSEFRTEFDRHVVVD